MPFKFNPFTKKLDITNEDSGGTVTSVSGTANRITSTGGAAPVIDIAATYVGQTSLTTLGTVTTGIWNATAIGATFGGTGRTSLTNHGVLVGAGTAAITQLGAGTAGQVLQSGGAAADPAYSTATFPSTATGTGTILRANGTNWVATTATYPTTTTINQILYSSATNTITGLATANRAVITTTSGGVPQATALATNGQLIIGSTAGAPAAATLTAGAGISITNGSNSITIADLPGASNGYYRVDSGISNVTGDNTAYDIIFDAASFQNGSDIGYNSGTGTFTFNTTGIYDIDVFITLTGFNSGVPSGIVFNKCYYTLKSGNGPGGGYDNPGAHFNVDSNGDVSYAISGLINANATDTFTVRVQVDGGTKVIGIHGNDGAGQQSTYLCYKRIK